MVPFIENGTIGASVYQDPYRQGRDAIRIVLDHLLEKAVIAPANYLNPAIVLRSNLSLFREVAGSFPAEGLARVVNTGGAGRNRTAHGIANKATY
jgi:LacI family transcriptional regulator